MNTIVVVGGGAAGILAAYSAAQAGAKVILLEKMAFLGRKLSITGKGRCNITNVCDIKAMIENIPGNGKFLYSAFHAFSNQDMVQLLEENGVPTKVERGGRIFPVSDKAKDVVGALEKILRQAGVEIRTQQKVENLWFDNQELRGVITSNGKVEAHKVIIAAGGATYPGTGSSGDGAKLAKQAGHEIVPLRPALVPLESPESWLKDVQGLSLRNVTATVYEKGVKKGQEFGEMLFTHFGVSGPIILSLSRQIQDFSQAELKINLKPALTEEVLDKRLQRDLDKYSRKQLQNALVDLLPASLIDVMIDLAFLDPHQFAHQVTREERHRLLEQLRGLSLEISGTRPLAEGIVTAGGVSVKEIHPKTMESKVLPGLYFAGEVMDVDGYTGGYNLQAAFSSGYVAGRAAAEAE